MSDMDRRTRPRLIRFLEKIRVSDTEWHDGSPCWLWAGGSSDESRRLAGKLYDDGSRRKSGVHVVSHEEFIGSVPAGCRVVRICDNWRCCSPLHLVTLPRFASIRRPANVRRKSNLRRAIESIRVSSDRAWRGSGCWLVPRLVGNKKHKCAPQAILLDYFLGQKAITHFRHRECGTARCSNPLHFTVGMKDDKTKHYKNLVYDQLGRRCYCCGESALDFLTIDHLKNNGAAHRKTVDAGLDLYQWLVRNEYPDGFGIACYNCNCGRVLNDRQQCPHKKVKQYAFEWVDSRSLSSIRNEQRRLSVIQQYGGKCYCCGESNVAFLTIDHKNNDGAGHRDSQGKRLTSVKLVRWAIKNNYPDTLQLACWNCNSGKGRSKSGICPHQQYLLRDAA